MNTAAEEIEAEIEANVSEYIKENDDGDGILEEIREDYVSDGKSDFRVSYDHETDVGCEWNRCYEATSVAKKLKNGKWVGWTYWSGGGKHGEPSSIEWIDEAYFLEIAGERTVTVYDFKKVDPT